MLFEVTASFESFVADAASEGRLHVAALDVIDQAGFGLSRVGLAAGSATQLTRGLHLLYKVFDLPCVLQICEERSFNETEVKQK